MAGGIDWLRWHHGSVSDGKFALVAHKAGATVAEAIAVWACLLEAASAADDRGNPGLPDFEALDFSLGMQEGKARRLYERMRERSLLDAETGRIAAWEKRQPKREREDDKSTERVRAFRQLKRQETPGNATERQETPRGEESREEKNKTRAGGEFSSVVAPDPTDPRPPSESDDPPPAPSLAGRACLACRGANVHDVNPSHPDLLRLLAAGVTPEDIGATAAECASKGKARFAYVLATVERRRNEAAIAPAIASARPVTVPSTDRQAEAFHAAMDERSATATRPPAAILALAGRIGL